MTASQLQGDVTVIAGQAWPVKVHSQREQLIARIQRDGFAQTLEAVAHTRFSRYQPRAIPRLILEKNLYGLDAPMTGEYSMNPSSSTCWLGRKAKGWMPTC